MPTYTNILDTMSNKTNKDSNKGNIPTGAATLHWIPTNHHTNKLHFLKYWRSLNIEMIKLVTNMYFDLLESLDEV